jgi:poly-gamma-glutamate synthesis protein (capsule biosynthesis protein)
VPRSFTLVAGGDVLVEKAVGDSAAAAGALRGIRYDFGPMFAPVAPLVIGADLAICHMETPVGRPGVRAGPYGRSPCGGNLLLAPYEVVTGLREIGFDRCSTASHHANDLGVDGIVDTLDVLDVHGLSHAGTARDEQESQRAGLLVGGVAVAHLSYTRSSNTVRPAPWWHLSYAASPGAVARDVQAARGGGAEVVVVSLHVGTELLRAPTLGDRAFVEELTAAVPVDPHRDARPARGAAGRAGERDLGVLEPGQLRVGDGRPGRDALRPAHA